MVWHLYVALMRAADEKVCSMKKINNKEIVDGSSLSLKANDNYTIAVTTT